MLEFYMLTQKKWVKLHKLTPNEKDVYFTLGLNRLKPDETETIPLTISQIAKQSGISQNQHAYIALTGLIEKKAVQKLEYQRGYLKFKLLWE